MSVILKYSETLKMSIACIAGTSVDVKLWDNKLGESKRGKILLCKVN